MTDHTPTPWRVEEGTDLIWSACSDDSSTYGMGYPIVEGKIPGWKPYKPDMEERVANAAFIVKAVNAHDALVEALEGLVSLGDTNIAEDIRKALRPHERASFDTAIRNGAIALASIKEHS